MRVRVRVSVCVRVCVRVSVRVCVRDAGRECNPERGRGARGCRGLTVAQKSVLYCETFIWYFSIFCLLDAEIPQT